jgi:hypothetical protein
MARPAPRPPLVAQLFVHVLERFSTTDRREVVAPSPNDRIEGFNQPFLPIHPMSPDHFCDLSFMLRHCLAAWGDDGLITALGLRGVLPHVASQKVTPGSTRFDVPRVCHPGFARLQFQSHPAQLFRNQRLTWLDHYPIRVYDHQIVRIPNHGRGIPPRYGPLDPFLQPMPRHVGS